MQIKIRVRPTQGCHYPGRIDDIEIDSSARLETIQEKYSTQGSTTRLYHGQHELPLNSSIGSHNFEDNAIIECCRSPALSAALSACLKDMDEINKLQPVERNRVNLMSILQTPLHVESDAEHEIWQPTSWTDESIKSRTINFAIIKSVLQRQDRYQVHDLPHCSDCQSLHDALQADGVWTGGSNGRKRAGFNSQAHIFKPKKKKTGLPSTNWILLEHKLEIQQQIKRELHLASSHHDYLEEFVLRDHLRHEAVSSAPKRRKKSDLKINRQDDSESYLAYLPHTPPRSAATSNHRSPEQNRSASVQAVQASPTKNKPYLPQYASAPFSILATLHLAMHSKHKLINGRKLTLTEDELKRYSQPTCRSNLYDKMRIRGRNAFACMDGLIEKSLVRKEIVRNPNASHGEIEKWGLLPDGERLGQCCAEFERAVRKVIPKEKIGAVVSAGKSMNVVLCVDTREDAHYLERMKWSCQDENVPIIEKELPAGDYLYLEESSSSEDIIPIVIERKSWSDLADSCTGKGNRRNRLDCVRILRDGDFGCAGDCQLCKMKRCGCTQILFIIEGERCLGLQHNAVCTVNNCCSACKLLSERYSITQTELEGVVTRLQLEHGCYVHYTKSFNDTIASLFCIRKLLQTNPSHSSRMLQRLCGNSSLSYERYKTNALSRRQNAETNQSLQTEITNLDEWDIETLVSVVDSSDWDCSTVQLLLGLKPKKWSHGNQKQPSEEPISLESDSDDASVEFVARPQRKQPETICLDSDSDDSIVEILSKSDDSVIIIDTPAPKSSAKDNKLTKRKSGQISASLFRDRHIDGDFNSILVIRHLSKHEARFGKALEMIWKEAHSCSDGDSRQLFDMALEKLNESSRVSALIHGRTVAAFGLWIQIIMGQQIRFVEQGNVRRDLMCLRDKRSECAASSSPGCNNRVASSSQWSGPKMWSTPPKPVSNPHCAEATSNKMSLNASLPSKNGTMREARLKRFDQSCTLASSYDFGSRGNGDLDAYWKCKQCTFHNPLFADKCEACEMTYDSGNFSPSSSKAINHSADAEHDILTSGWDCDKCSYKNGASAVMCSTCGTPNASNDKPRLGKKQRHTHANEPWICEGCASENRKKDRSCYGCGLLNRDHPDFGSETYSSGYQYPEQITSRPNSSAKKRIKCGACGNEGHIRSSATSSNCPAYFNESEIERREKMEQKKLAAIEHQRQSIVQLEREGKEAAMLYQEWKEKTEAMERNNAQAEQYRNQALKRAKDKMKRLQKRKR